jgi:hypothetical protein
MNDQDHSLSLSDPDRSLVLSHLLVNFLKNLVSCQTSLRNKKKQKCSTLERMPKERGSHCQRLYAEQYAMFVKQVGWIWPPNNVTSPVAVV